MLIRTASVRVAWVIALAMTIVCILPGTASADVREGDKPVIDWKASDGTQVNAERLAGWVAVVHFWAPDDDWSKPNAAEMVRLEKEYSRRGVMFVGVSFVTREADLKKFVKETSYAWLQCADYKGYKSETPKAWGVETPPQAFVLTPTGEVAWRGNPAALDNAIRNALEKTPPKLGKEPLTKMAVELLKEAQKQLDANKEKQDYREPLRLLGFVSPTVTAELAVVTAAKKVVPYFDPAAKRDKDALEIYYGTYPEAAKVLTALKEQVKIAATQPAGKPAAEVAAEKANALAKARYDAAMALKAKPDDAAAYRAFKRITEVWKDSPVAKDAAERVKEYESNEALMASIKKEERERSARELVDMAKSYKTAGKTDLAQETYERVLKDYADTAAAADAKAGLGK